jgi:hypothetical protein
VIAAYAIVLLSALPGVLVQDSWMTLVGGREIAQHGLPTHDHLAAWTAGAGWIDQQWLAQLFFYGLFAGGGLKLVLLSHAGLLTAAFASALVSARRRGASEKSVCLVGVLAMFAAPWALQLRAQTVGTLLFVWVLALLLADSRAPSRRVLLVLPLLALWANVHGTVLLGAVLAIVRGLTIIISSRRGREPAWRLRSAGLLLVAPLCLVASPYGLSLVGYYRRIAANPLMSRYVLEWHASAPSKLTAIFFVLAFVAVWLVARHGQRLTGFEQIALFLTLASGLWALRSISWFALTALLVLPITIDGVFAERPRRASLRRARRSAGLIVALLLAGGVGVAAARPSSWFVQQWPTRALPTIQQATLDPSTRVFANDRYADWLLWQLPELRGRIAYDVRFELFNGRQFRQLHAYRSQIGDDWRRAAAGYQLLMFERSGERMLSAAVSRGPGTKVVYQDSLITLVAQQARQTAVTASTARTHPIERSAASPPAERGR